MRILILLLLAGCASTSAPPPCDRECGLRRTLSQLHIEFDINRMRHNVYAMCKRARGYDKADECMELAQEIK